MALDSHLFLSYTISTMKVGDLVTMDTPLTPERYGVGIVQKIGRTQRIPAAKGRDVVREVYSILWPDGAISHQYDNEIVLISKV